MYKRQADLICMLHANNQVSPSSIAAESVQQLTARMAELRDSDNLSDQGNPDNVSSLRRVG